MLKIKYYAQVQGDNAMTGQKATANLGLEGSNPPAETGHQEEGQQKSKVEKVKEALHLTKQ